MKIIKSTAGLLVVTSLMFGALQAQAQVAHLSPQSREIEGTRGGGEVITVKDRKELRDLYSNSVCEWTNGASMMTAAPYIRTVLDKISALDWYFAFDLEREITKLDWCQTGKLIRVKTEDNDSLTIVENTEKEQVAIRILETNEVYLDNALFNQMSERSKAYLVLHETIHSYLDINANRRNDKLRSIVKALYKAESGSIKTREELRYSLAANKINFDGNTDMLDPYKAFVLFVLGDNASKQTILESVSDITAFLNTSSDIKKFQFALNGTDLSTVSLFNPITGFAKICVNSPETFVEKMFDGSHGLSPELAIAALSALSSKPALKARVLSSEYFTAQIREIIKMISEIKPAIVNARITMPSVIKFMAKLPPGGSKDIEVMALGTMYSSKDFATNAVASGLYTYIQNLIQIGNWEKLAAVITSNPAFYAGFSMNNQIAMISQLDAPVVREKTYAIQNLIRVKRQFWKCLLEKLASDTTPEAYAHFESMLDKSKLGI